MAARDLIAMVLGLPPAKGPKVRVGEALAASCALMFLTFGTILGQSC
jgi:hypothetical protein